MYLAAENKFLRLIYLLGWIGVYMKKSRLYTKNEELRFIGVIFLVIYIVANITHIYIRGLDEIAIKVAMGSTGILLIIELIIFPFWYIPERMKQKAIKYGEVYIGRYYDIITKKQFVISPHQRRTCYVLKIEIEIDGKKEIVCNDLYNSNPGYYITKNQECKVYKYRGKFYSEIIYYNPKAKTENIFEYYEHEQELDIPNVKYLRNSRDINVYMTAKVIANKPIYTYKINLEKEICALMDEIRKERRILRDDQEVIKGIESIVRNELSNIDSIIQIMSIDVSMYG